MEALLIIDMCKDFVTGRFGFEGSRKIIPKIERVLHAARKRGLVIVFTRDAHLPGDPELAVWGQHAMEGTDGSEIIPELSPAREEIVIKKRTYSAFFGTELERVLKEKGVSELILTGVVTHICVQHTAADGFFRGFKIKVLSDCTAAPDQELHERALEYMKRIYGALILGSDELLRGWGVST